MISCMSDDLCCSFAPCTGILSALANTSSAQWFRHACAFDLRALLDTVIVVSIVAIAAVGFVAGMKELILDLRKLRRAKV